jgi:hypothetical protein
MFKRIAAKNKADRRAERERWHGLSHAEKWAEMAAAGRRWRHLANDHAVNQVTHQVTDQVIGAVEE